MAQTCPGVLCTHQKKNGKGEKGVGGRNGMVGGRKGGRDNLDRKIKRKIAEEVF